MGGLRPQPAFDLSAQAEGGSTPAPRPHQYGYGYRVGGDEQTLEISPARFKRFKFFLRKRSLTQFYQEDVTEAT